MSNTKHAGSRSYYKDVVPGFEYMDVMEHVLGYEGVVAHLRGQIFKYSFRLGKKDKASSESEKISWYAARLDDVIKRYEANDGSFPIENPLVLALIEKQEVLDVTSPGRQEPTMGPIANNFSRRHKK